MRYLLNLVALLGLGASAPTVAQVEDELTFVVEIPFGSRGARELPASASFVLHEADPFTGMTCGRIICKRATPPEPPWVLDFEAISKLLRELSAPIPVRIDVRPTSVVAAEPRRQAVVPAADFSPR